ncbi:uncharacterized protein LOC135692714 isoform X3 [Rhopilema esculentum]|uniref:uncharacterized protein LOC135692714 isoform X3 n=1 Tax=Rhopilema esculentum TaxID=499914 RepID=UPI0031CE0D07
MDVVKEVRLMVNGLEYVVVNPDPDLYLTDWLRDKAFLKGVKKLCDEGGCGSCIVAISKDDPIAHPQSIVAVNSCLQPVISLDGYHVITAEGLGSKKDGFHKIQETFAEQFASQCGFCTPGIIMNGFSYLANDSNGRSKEEIEKSLDGNICRCTGYRPILDAMKSFSKDAGVIDIEDFRKIKCCMKNCTKQKPKLVDLSLEKLSTSSWYSPECLNELFATLKKLNGKAIKLTSGNTGVGIFKNEGSFDAYVGLKRVKELREMKMSENEVEVGACVTLSDLILFLKKNFTQSTAFSSVVEHLEKVASLPIRNVATWAGNIMLVNLHKHFPSDVYVIFSAIGAKLKIADTTGVTSYFSMEEFFTCDMSHKVIVSASLPVCKADDVLKTFKVMPRKQNSYGYVNAGFYATFDKSKLLFTKKPRLIFGGVGLEMLRATDLENFLEGKNLDEPDLFANAAKMLQNCLKPNPENKLVNFDYCKNVAVNLLYKFCLFLNEGRSSKRSLSAIENFVSPVSSGAQTFHVSEDENSSVNKPFIRIEGKVQASGENQYVGDIPLLQNEAYAAYVLSPVASATLEGIDLSEAKNHPGFIASISAKDVPGVNNWRGQPSFEEIFPTKEISYYGQPIALVIANSQRNAEKIAKMVKVKYSNVKEPVTTLEEAIRKKCFHPTRFPDIKVGDTDAAFTQCDHVVEGEAKCGSQHNFYIEPQTCLVVPQDIGYKVYSTTQCSRLVQEYVSRALGMKASSIDIHVPRLGGGFGGKIEYPSKIASAVAVAAHTLDRPVRMTMTLSDNLNMVGKRAPFIAKYKVGFSKEGMLQACDVILYNDSGIAGDNYDGYLAGQCLDNAYYCPNWNIRNIDCKTNTPFNTFVRAPGHVQGMFIGETIIEHVASFLGKNNSVQIKELNLYKNGQVSKSGVEISNCLLDKIWNDIKITSDYDQRKSQIEQFNKENRWKKRGISMMPLKYDTAYGSFNFTVVISIYHADATVAVSVGGIEMGQGMNSRVCQVVANQLQIPMDLITVKHHSTITTPNCSTSGGSIASEINCLAAHKCSEVLIERMKPVKEKNPGASWLELVKACAKEKVELSCQYMFFAPDKKSFAYSSYGAACSEVEIDVLTGEHWILRSDIIFDCGESVNPQIDIGQIEGAFVMGIGYWFTEKIAYDEKTGKQLTTSTWNYKPPMSQDIPKDFRVKLNHDAVNPIGYIRSKAIGEPGICMASTCLFAAKKAIEAARSELGKSAEYFQLDLTM